MTAAMIQVYNNIQSQQDKQLRLKTLQGLNSETMQYSDFQYHTGYLPENAMEMPLPRLLNFNFQVNIL